MCLRSVMRRKDFGAFHSAADLSGYPEEGETQTFWTDEGKRNNESAII